MYIFFYNLLSQTVGLYKLFSKRDYLRTRINSQLLSLRVKGWVLLVSDLRV